MNNEKIIDYYRLYNIDRNLDEKAIRKQLSDEQRKWMKRQSSTNDPEKLAYVKNMVDGIAEALLIFRKKDRRDEYDRKLDIAYQNGQIDTKEEAIAKETMEKAKQSFEKGNIKLAYQFAQEALSAGVHDPACYDISSQCLFEMGDYEDSIDMIEKGNGLFTNNDDLEWRRIRYYIEIENFRTAQALINMKLNQNNKCSWAHAQQIYLYYYAGRKDMAFYAIDKYLEKNPNDLVFRQHTAYNLISFANSYYEIDAATGAFVIARESAYNECLRLIEKAHGLWQDEYIESKREQILYFGEKYYDKRNVPAIVIYGVLAGIAALVGFNIPLLFIAAAGAGAVAFLIHRASYIPNWKLNRTLYSGVDYRIESTFLELFLAPFNIGN